MAGSQPAALRGAARTQRARARSGELAAAAALTASLAHVVCRIGIPIEEARAPTPRGRPPGARRKAVEARHAAIYLAVTAFGRPIRAVSRVAGLPHQVTGRIVRRIEDARDDPRVDQFLTALEGELSPSC